MSNTYSRRDFLKLGGLALGGLALNPFPPPHEEGDYTTGELGRIAHPYSISVYKYPDDKSPIIFQRFRDELVNIYYEVTPASGPSWNPLWYRVWGGYLHSAHVQRVKIRLNQPMKSLPSSGHQLCEVTVPYTQVYQYNNWNGWERKLRLYYLTTHWAVGIDQGPDGGPWYRLYDELREDEYHVSAFHLRPISDEEISPLSPDVPPQNKHIEVSLQGQKLTVYEYNKVVLETKISSGIPSGGRPPEGTGTPQGNFRIYSKMPTKHMGGSNLSFAPSAYTLPGVPWTMFFEQSGVALHGTYWHNNFGVPMSHGCVNMRTEDAKWLFRWTTPTWPPEPGDKRFWERTGNGTEVHVI